MHPSVLMSLQDGKTPLSQFNGNRGWGDVAAVVFRGQQDSDRRVFGVETQIDKNKNLRVKKYQNF